MSRQIRVRINAALIAVLFLALLLGGAALAPGPVTAEVGMRQERPTVAPGRPTVEPVPDEGGGDEGGGDEAPVEEAPVEEAPVEEAPVEEAPVEEAPVEGEGVVEEELVPKSLPATGANDAAVSLLAGLGAALLGVGAGMRQAAVGHKSGPCRHR